LHVGVYIIFMNFIGFVVAIYEVADADLQRWNDEQQEQLDRKKKEQTDASKYKFLFRNF
jgi:hypothetical protein